LRDARNQLERSKARIASAPEHTGNLAIDSSELF
jgi:hypothetical protein